MQEQRWESISAPLLSIQVDNQTNIGGTTMVKFDIDPQKTVLIVFDMHNQIVKPQEFDPLAAEIPQIVTALAHVEKGLVPQVKRLIAHCRSKGIPLIYTYNAYREDGSDMGLVGQIIRGVREKKRFIRGMRGIQIYAEVAPQKGDIVIEKHRYNAFYGSDLELILRGLSKDTLIITGATLDMGLESTVRDAVDRDFKVILPSDGVAAKDIEDEGWGAIPHDEVERVVLSSLAHRFAMVLTTEELVSKLR
jgi:nicotinamidase-related amidase